MRMFEHGDGTVVHSSTPMAITDRDASWPLTRSRRSFDSLPHRSSSSAGTVTHFHSTPLRAHATRPHSAALFELALSTPSLRPFTSLLSHHMFVTFDLFNSKHTPFKSIFSFFFLLFLRSVGTDCWLRAGSRSRALLI